MILLLWISSRAPNSWTNHFITIYFLLLENLKKWRKRGITVIGNCIPPTWHEMRKFLNVNPSMYSVTIQIYRSLLKNWSNMSSKWTMLLWLRESRSFALLFVLDRSLTSLFTIFHLFPLFFALFSPFSLFPSSSYFPSHYLTETAIHIFLLAYIGPNIRDLNSFEGIWFLIRNSHHMVNIPKRPTPYFYVELKYRVNIIDDICKYP